MNIGNYIAGIFQKKTRIAPFVQNSEKAVAIKEVPVLLPIPLNFEVVGGEWEVTDSQNLETFLLTESGKKLQQQLMLKYGIVLKDGMAGMEEPTKAIYLAKGVLKAVTLIKELANPAAYDSADRKLLSRANSKWGVGIGLVNKAPILE